MRGKGNVAYRMRGKGRVRYERRGREGMEGVIVWLRGKGEQFIYG